MTGDLIDDPLSAGFQLPETGERARSPIQSLIFDQNLGDRKRDLLSDLDFPKPQVVVCDPNTYGVLAKRVSAAIPNGKLVVIETPRADEATAQQFITTSS